MPVVVVLAFYGIWLGSVFASGHDVRDFIHMGRTYVAPPRVRALFKLDPKYHYTVQTNGYDGQFAYYIALAPVGARMHVDRVNYRYTRILYPLLARALSLGRPEAIPYMLIVINWMMMGVGTFALGLWLKRNGVTPWFALVYGLSPGVFICLHRDLEEPLSYGLVAVAMYLYAYGGRHRLVWSGTAFALAALSRESTAVFPVVLGLYLYFQTTSRDRRSREGAARFLPALFPALSLAPLLAFKAFLFLWLGPSTPSFPPGLHPQLLPFAGILLHWPWNVRLLEIVDSVVLPALLTAVIGIRALRGREAQPEVWLLLANIQLFVVMLNPLTYLTIIASARVSTGVLLAAIWCVPAFDRLTGRKRAWLWASIALWFVPWPTLIPMFERPLRAPDLLLVLSVMLLLWVATERPWQDHYFVGDKGPSALPGHIGRRLSESGSDAG